MGLKEVGLLVGVSVLLGLGIAAVIHKRLQLVDKCPRESIEVPQQIVPLDYGEEELFEC